MRTAIVKLERSKPLIIDPDGTIVNIHDQNHGAVPRPPQEAGQVNTITLNPIINLRDSQRNDPHLASIIDMKAGEIYRYLSNEKGLLLSIQKTQNS